MEYDLNINNSKKKITDCVFWVLSTRLGVSVHQRVNGQGRKVAQGHHMIII